MDRELTTNEKAVLDQWTSSMRDEIHWCARNVGIEIGSDQYRAFIIGVRAFLNFLYTQTEDSRESGDGDDFLARINYAGLAAVELTTSEMDRFGWEKPWEK